MLTRRDGLLAGLAGLGLMAAPGEIWAQVRQSPQIADPALARVCDLVIPRTATPGALETGVADYVRLVLAHADGVSLDGTEWRTVQAALAAQGFGAGAQDARILTAFDAAAFGPHADAAGKAWHKVKSLIVTGYYTSEAGGSQELHYELVPGRFDADLPTAKAMPALSNDWIAVTFR